MKKLSTTNQPPALIIALKEPTPKSSEPSTYQISQGPQPVLAVALKEPKKEPCSHYKHCPCYGRASDNENDSE